MSPTLKKVLLIVLLLVVAGGIAYGLYYMFTRTGAPTQPAGQYPQLPSGGQLPSAGNRPATTTGGAGQPVGVLPSGGVITPTGPGLYQPQAVKQITDTYVTNPSLNQAGNFRYYNAADGKFYKVAADGSIKSMSDSVFYNAQKVTWANSKDSAVIEYPDGSKIVYDFANQKQTSLPNHWQEFSFSPDGTQIAAKSLGLSPDNQFLITTNVDATGARIIEPMGDNADQVTVDWSPNKQVVAFSQTGEPLGSERREVLLIGLNGENFKSLTVEGLGFQPQWSTTGDKLIYSVYSSRSDYKPELWVVDSSGNNIGNNRKMLGLDTWADKCTFSNDTTLYCAVPRDLPQGAAMAREIANDSVDDLYKIDLKTGLKTIIPLNGDYNINNISYNQAQNAVEFTDLNQSGIFQTKL
ncbi:MAG: hypothetical protein WC526_00995 [Patescibacteria group bacterium]